MGIEMGMRMGSGNGKETPVPDEMTPSTNPLNFNQQGVLWEKSTTTNSFRIFPITQLAKNICQVDSKNQDMC